MNPFSYPSVEPRFNLRLKNTNDKWLHYDVDFPIAKPTNHKEHNTAFGEYYQPSRGDNWPLAILVHGLGNRSTLPCSLLARDLARRGIASFVLYLVFHSSRMPEVIKRRLPVLTADEWFEGYQTSVTDVRQVVDWASSQPEIDKGKIAVIGISFGGFISAIAMGVDRRLKAGVFLVAGGNYENPAWAKKRRHSRQEIREVEHHQAQNDYTDYLAEVAKRGLENVNPAKKSFLTDPMTFATYLQQRPILILNALWDEYIPKQAVLDFWEACGKPAITWFPATHITIWLWYPFISWKISRFLRSTFGM